MAVYLPNGAAVAVASTYGASQSISAFTNANPGVATVTSHGYANGDLLEITSGWDRMNGRIFRAAGVATNTFQAEGEDTSNTTTYPAGSGTGSVRKITAWQTLQQIIESSSTGGDQQFAEYAFLNSNATRRIPTDRNPFGITFTIADDPTLPQYAILAAADNDRAPRAVRVSLPSGGVILYHAYLSMSRTPTLTRNQLMTVQVTLSLVGDPTRYAS